MNILYIHGYKSSFDPETPKIKSLEKLGNVIGLNIDYDKPYDEIHSEFYRYLITNDVDLIIGTSFGGYFANRIGTEFGIPFVMVNPVIDPRRVLKKYDHPTDIINSYERRAVISPCGLLLLDRGDDVIPIEPTIEYFNDFYETHIFEGGSHRFEHMDDSLDYIEQFYNINNLIHGSQ
jgi:hypothetical protein